MNSTVSFSFPMTFSEVADQIIVSNETYKKLEDAVVKAFEKIFPVQVGDFVGIPVYAYKYMPNDTGLVLGPDPDFPGQKKILKILKFTA